MKIKINIFFTAILIIFITTLIVKFVFNFSWISTLIFNILLFIALGLTLLKNKIAYIFIILIASINFLMIVFALIPDNSQQIDLKQFYQNKKNYIQILKVDSNEFLKKNKVMIIINPGQKIIKLWKVSRKSKFEIKSQDSITYFSKTKNLKTIVNIILWDGSILQVKPQTKIKMEKIFKNLENLTLSKTKIKIEKGGAWIRTIRTIISQDGFNVSTDDGTLVIRGTSTFIYKTDQSSIAYSHDHIVEVRNVKGEKEILQPKKAVAFTKEEIKQIDLIYLKQLIPNFEKQLQTFLQTSQQLIQDYKNKLLDFIQEQIDSIGKTNMIGKLASIKTKILNQDLNFKQLNINGNQILIKTENIKDLIFVPFTKQLQQEKLNYLYQQGKNNLEYLKTYIIQTVNYTLDQGKAVNFDNIKNLLKIKDIQNLKNILQNLTF